MVETTQTRIKQGLKVSVQLSNKYKGYNNKTEKEKESLLSLRLDRLQMDLKEKMQSIGVFLTFSEKIGTIL